MEFKNEGNKLFELKRWSEAVEQYTLGLEKLGAAHSSIDLRPIPLRTTLLSNRSQCQLNLECWQAAIDDAGAALHITPHHVKSLLRRSIAFEKLGRLHEALNDVARVVDLEPEHVPAGRSLERLRTEFKKQQHGPKVKANVTDSPWAAELEAFLNEMEVLNVSVNQETPLHDYSILGPISHQRKESLEERCKQDAFLDRAMGSMCGMAIGDSVGHKFEFLPCQDTPGKSFFDLETMRFHEVQNQFELRHGQWTDDAAMGLCMADSLIARRGYDGSDMRQRFWNWWERGYNNAFRLDKSREDRHSVGLGENISKSLKSMVHLRSGDLPTPIYEATSEDAGNGSLMRFAPLALFFHAVPAEDLCYFAKQSSYTTHPGIIAAEACALLAHLIVRALKRPPGEPLDPKQFLEDATAEYLKLSGLEEKRKTGDARYEAVKWLVTGYPERSTEQCWAWREREPRLVETIKARGRSYNGYPVSAGYFGSYALDGLAIAMWAVYNTTSFDEAVAKAVNTLGDADSHGSICGQLAGALYGLSSVQTRVPEVVE